jgi:hypothetical protein
VIAVLLPVLSTIIALAALAVSVAAYRAGRASHSSTRAHHSPLLGMPPSAAKGQDALRAVDRNPQAVSPPVTSEEPSRLRLAVRVLEGRARRTIADDTREYLLRIALENAGGSAAAVSGAALRVTYRTRANFLGAVDLAPLSEPQGQPPFELPARVSPGATVSGWLFFRTANVIPRHCRAQDYALVISTADGHRLIADASLPSLLASDTDGQGPATWGWD